MPAIAREERTRTADLLFTAPVTRREVTISKAVVLIGNLALACGSFAVGAMAAAALIDLEGFDPGDALAGVVHLFFLGLAFAMIALAAGNVTGSTSVRSPREPTNDGPVPAGRSAAEPAMSGAPAGAP